MLTEEEREKIREEEIFRQEVRRQLEATKLPASKHQRLWEALNSSFVLWCLSTVLVGVIGWAYTSHQSKEAEAKQKREKIHNIDMEIRNRIDATTKSLLALKSELRNRRTYIVPEYVYGRAYAGIDKNDSEYSVVSYPEYQDMSFTSLVNQLKELVEAKERTSLDNASAYLEQLRNASMEQSGINTNRPTPINQEEVEASVKAVEKATNLINDLMLPRWRKIK